MDTARPQDAPAPPRLRAIAPRSGARPPAPAAQPDSPPDSPRPRTGRHKSARPSTYAVRKREKAALTRQLAHLSRQIEALRAERRVAAVVMRRAIQAQQHAVAYTQAAVSGIAQQTMHLASPFGRGLRLSGTDAERDAALRSRRGASVRAGRAFLAARRQFVDDAGGALREARTFETRAGDYCISRFEVVPVRLEEPPRGRAGSSAAENVRRVADALARSLSNAELVISETSEFLTIRQAGDSFAELGAHCLSARGVALQRVLSSDARGSLLVEAEAATFLELFDRDADGIRGPHAVMTTEAVDADERYPYAPAERVRRDVSSVILVSAPQSAPRPAERGEDAAAAVVLTLWSACAFRFPSGATAEAVRAVPPQYKGWGGGMLKDVQEILRCPHLAQ